MRVLTGGQWSDGYLDYARGPGDVRVQVLALCNLRAVDGMYVVRAASTRMLWNYAREVGPAAVWRRVRSRMGERGRNEKYLSCGIGRVTHADAGGPAGLVVFLAPGHPRCAERLVLPRELVLPVESAPGVPLKQGAVLHLPERGEGAAWCDELRGWSADSGVALDAERCAALLQRAATELRAADWGRAAALPCDPPSPVTEFIPPASPPPDDGRRKSAVLFGYGNYAKVTSLPHVERHLRLTAVHEIDPTQVPPGRRADVAWDSSGALRPDERPDAVLIAGYHHTHAPLAVEALRRGAYAVVEKPLCTTHAQLDEVMRAVEGQPRLLACFQKRYLRFNQMALEDLAVRPGDAVNYHCVVYEIPLPALHWYRWPSSRTRLVSNGCHWIDHFLFLNRFAEPRWWDVAAAPDGTLNVSVLLENGAFFSMVLTDRGSERLGVQEHVELRANDRTVCIENASRYRAESTERVLRRAHANRLESYRRMYGTIARIVAEGRPGDPPESVRVPSQLVLDLEARLAEVLAAQGDAADPAEPVPAWSA